MKKDKRISTDRLSFVWLAAAFLMLLFSNGFYMVPIAAWLGPVFMIRFLRGARPLKGLLAGYLVNTAVFVFAWLPAFQDAGIMFSLFTAFIGMLVYLPYVADRLISPRVKGFLSTLIFPAAWVAVEYMLHLLLPLGTFFNLAYTQNTNLPLLQIMSITGLWGVSFLVTWFSSVVNYVWEHGFDLKKAFRNAAVYVLILAAVMMGGGLRLALARPAANTVQVSVLTTNINGEPLPDAATPEYTMLVEGKLPEVEIQAIKEKMDAVNEDMFTRARTQARAGSKIITFSEFNVQAFTWDEQRVLNEAANLAREENIYLAFPFELTEPDLNKRDDPAIFQVNKSVMITPEGEIAYQYLKHNLLIGPEMEHTIRGERKILSIDTPYGRLASVICLDMEYPDFMRLAAQQNVDIVLSGAIDGTVSTKGNPLHSIMASYRTIEDGFSLARAGYYGQNIAADYQGRIIGAANHYTAGDRTVTARLPVKGVKTLYGTVGDFLPLAACALMAYFIAYAVIAGNKAGKKQLAGKETGLVP
jgi:apolipoprotein N-acyltransferase